MGWESHVEIIPDRIGFELLALPEKIVVVGDGRQAGFGDDFGNGQTEGNVEGMVSAFSGTSRSMLNLAMKSYS
jgi:hypothetical protein